MMRKMRQNQEIQANSEAEQALERNLDRVQAFAHILLAMVALRYLLTICNRLAGTSFSGFGAQTVLSILCAGIALLEANAYRLRGFRRRTALLGWTLVFTGLGWSVLSFLLSPTLWGAPFFYCIVVVLLPFLLYWRLKHFTMLLVGGEVFWAFGLLRDTHSAADYLTAFTPTLAAALAAWEVARLHERSMRQFLRREDALSHRIDTLSSENRRLQYVSETDALTKVFNRQKFDEYAASIWRKQQDAHQVLSMFMIDIDLFKNYNDYYGHVRGDYCLAHIAQVIRHICTPYGLSFRYGGEEFAVLMPGVETAQAVKIAERLRASIEALHIPNAGVGRIVTVSIGVAAQFPMADDNLSVFIDNADKSLYIAKQQGRNRVVCADNFYEQPN